MEPVSLILGAVAILGVTAVVIALLKWRAIVSWFQSRKGKLSDPDKKRIATTITTALKNGQAEVVQGIFDMDTEDFVDVQVCKAEELDEAARVNLSGSQVKIYT